MRLFFAVAVLAASTLSASAAAPTSPRAIRHSDVVFMYDNPALYEAYGCTVMGWAGTADAKHIEAAHAKGVRLFSTSIGFRTEFNRVIDFSPNFLDAACRNLAGEPFIVPWLWDHKHKGERAWWWCTNSPLYRQYLERRLVEVMKTRPDGLHIDDYSGTVGAVSWLSGGFCPHCMAGFREYLAKHVSKDRLTELGVTDLEKFDYRKFLLDQGVKAAEYQKQRGRLPLAAEFLDFQVKANTAFVAEYRRRAEERRGKPLTLCVNSALHAPDALAIARHLSYFCCEVPEDAAGLTVPKHPAYVYKLADGLDRPVAATASGQDWAYVGQHKLPGLVRTWIALAYAYGHNFMAPHHQWCYTQEKGTHWLEGRTEDYTWLYQFVRRNARLLDGYEAVAPVAVVYDNAARRQGKGNIEPICVALADRNMPFTVVVAGDDWVDYRLDAARLGNFRAVVVTKDLSMDEQQRGLIEQVRAAGRLVTWPDDAALERLVPTPVRVEGSQHVGVVVRGSIGFQPVRREHGLEAYATVVHLLNREYERQRDTVVPQKDITVRLRRDLLDGRKFSKAIMHAPQAEPVALAVTSDDGETAIKVPQLGLWGIVELSD